MVETLEKRVWVGVDVGSTTVKIAVADPVTGDLLYSRYQRHNAMQSRTALALLEEAHEQFPDRSFQVAFCGSGAGPFAPATGAHFVQEVVANSLAVRKKHPDTRVAIELGGQDAKVIFFERDPVTGNLLASDMRMNGVCAGGTGAFIDQVAELLRIRSDEFEGYAARGTNVYEISGRCGVFAKTDIQPLLNQGVAKEDIALSSFHAIAKQTIGGLAQGMEIHPPVLFEGGPLTFCPTLVRVFKERLGITEDKAIVPDNAEVFVAWGAALSIGAMFQDAPGGYDHERSISALRDFVSGRETGPDLDAALFFENEQEHAAFVQRHHAPFVAPTVKNGSRLEVVLGIDAGSTTTKFVFLDRDNEVVDSFYSGNQGDPLQVLKEALNALRERYEERGIDLVIEGVGTTGYGEHLFSRALKADYHTVETVAHARAARHVRPDVSHILDIGGQDMKSIGLQDGVVTGIILNEACSSGCGSFIETYARSLGVKMEDISEMAFASTTPSRLGSRCTVFMNSSIITEQRDGKSPSDILAGICRSVIENVFTKVVRVRNFDILGKVVMVQGGTFKNDAVLRAFEQYTGLEAVRPPRPGVMGAIGIALLTREVVEKKRALDPAWQSTFVGLPAMEDFVWEKSPGQICRFCSNNCSRTVITFGDGSHHVTGNRCERGEVIDDPNDPATKKAIAEITRKMRAVPDMLRRHNQLLLQDWKPREILSKKSVKIGIPRVLEFWTSMPFWKTFFEALGYEVVVSKQSDYKLFEEGLNSVPSDTVCFPAKLVHGHVLDLVAKKVDRLFLPVMLALPSEHKQFKATAVCPVVQGYPIVVKNSDDPEGRHDLPVDQPVFHWITEALRESQCVSWFSENWNLPAKAVREAVHEGVRALKEFREIMQNEGAAVLEQCRQDGKFAVVIGGRPYHADMLVNHHVASHFTQKGIPVLTLESLPGTYDIELPQNTRMEAVNSYHCRLLSAALLTSRDPALELVQIVSFGCGHDATITDELMRLMHENGDKEMLVLKLDEGDVRGPMGIRINSFVETVTSRRESGKRAEARTAAAPFPQVFTLEDKGRRTVLIPNLSPAFSALLTEVFADLGQKTVHLPVADEKAIALGKKFVHNDICFPAQINIGESLRWLEDHPEVAQEDVAIGLAKNCENCRAGQYATLARKALDEAGYERVAIVTTGRDTKGMHPGFQADLRFRISMLWGMAMIDAMDAMVRLVRPYELVPGQSTEIYDRLMAEMTLASAHSYRKGLRVFKRAVEEFNAVEVDRSVRKPRVGVLGEILMKYHPAANGYVEKYLEEHGMEVVRPGMLDFFRRDEMRRMNMVKRGMLEHPLRNYLIGGVSAALYSYAADKVEGILKKFRWYEHHSNCNEMVELVEGMVDEVYDTGEGWLIPAEILSLAPTGVNSFVIVQPFACLANHISGRGMTKTVKSKHPHIQILSLDYDPDTSFANIENRLQMLIINARELEKSSARSSELAESSEQS